ncbi:cation:proton antiporter [Oceanispirochaeta crateris]|jgi:multicomponent Na+:H+ antiporter subunit G|uniref:Cation:proton antiporter n=1 Tax=Oceanispirochaeta crateris TaxID=2518645 RepID=A0A5C1QMM8_9SPIO|nr:monovalent cation/H(+) antiporter subunit G [Oceanispirochaeta crateris]QEN08921.1 cation:proton antiporter [Oceanispirochaeta crateris]
MVETILSIVAFIAFLTAVIFGGAGVFGLFKFKNPYAKLQSGSLCGTTAVISILIGCLALAPTWAMAARIMIIGIFFLISSPTGTHIVARFAWVSGQLSAKEEDDADFDDVEDTQL